MTISFIAKEGKILPAYQSDASKWERCKRKMIDEKIAMRFEVIEDRNIQHHKKYWAILETYCANKEEVKSADVHYAFKVKWCELNPDYYEVIEALVDGKYRQVKTVFSEAPSRMTQIRFQPYYDFVIKTLSESLGCTIDELENNCGDYL